MRSSFLKKTGKLLGLGLFYLILAIAIAWSTMAILIDGPQNDLGLALAGFFLVGQICALFFIPKKTRLLSSLVLIFFVIAWWTQIKPSNNRYWTADVAQLPSAHFDGDLVTIKNLRNFKYTSETDFTENWEERTYDLSKVKSFNVFLSYWGPKWMAHAISSWEFEDGQHLAISIETRKEVGESYSALLGFFRQFELYYVVADEEDVIKLRTNFRNEDVYLYQMKTSPEVARALLEDYLKEVNHFQTHPRWYNAITTNCSTVIREQISHVDKIKPWNWKMLANGYLDELAYSRGQIDNSIPFSEVKRQAYINDRAKNATGNFSQAIREKLVISRN